MQKDRIKPKAPDQVAQGILTKFQVKSAPVQVKEIAKSIGLKVIPYDLGEDVSGILVIEQGKGTIGYHPGNSRLRQRFTIAHELGHFLLHTITGSDNEVFIDKDFIVKYRTEKKYTQSEIQQERDANAFAAELLMPKELIKSEMVKKEYADLSEMEFIEKLAKTFEVSVAAMTIRANNLDLFH